VLLYVIDTLRADHLGCYGYSRATSPNIDALSDGGILFTRMVAQSSWTRPATASILTGLDPLAHGASTLSARIRPQVVTLADLLHARGYHTAAFVTNVNVRGEMGFRRGFDEYVYLPEDHERPTVHLPADELNAHVFRWLEERRPTPFFLYVHASDPHAPYHPPAAIAARFLPTDGLPPIAGEHDPLRLLLADRTARTEENLSYLRALYDGEIAFTDEAFGALRGKLRELGLEAGTLVAVTADHGEEFLDHGGFEHGRTLYGELLRVPFILRLPRGERGGQQIERLARQVDVVPTLLAALGLPARGELPGSDLLASDGPEPEAFSHTGLGSAEIMALTTTGWKVIHRADRQHDTFEIYDLREDPAERRDLAASRPVLLGYGRQALVRRAVDVPRPAYGVEDQAAIIDSDTARRLRALGYVSR
jgi:arylsulfatase A-like enzyme